MAEIDSGARTRDEVRVFRVPMPEYRIDSVPDYNLGVRVDQMIRENFDVARIIVRAISSTDHPPLTLDELAKTILELGTDKYDPYRRGVAHDEFEPYHADFHAGPFEVDEDPPSFFGGVMKHFYEDAPADRGHPLRIDLLLIYDGEQLERADRPDPGKPRVRPRLETFLFRFKNPARRKDALLGLVKIP